MQLSLSFEHDPDFLIRLFEKAAGMSVSLVLTDNSSSMLSVRRKGHMCNVRLHRIFLGADGGTLDEIASFIKRGRGKMPGFRTFINRMSASIKHKPPRPSPVRTTGKWRDLQIIFERLNKEYFGGKLVSAITWGSGTPKRSVRMRTLGSYSSRTDTIRINPVLDKITVPAYYIEFVVYHEMLHAALGIHEKNGRRSVHTHVFRERERLFKEYERALRWERKSI